MDNFTQSFTSLIDSLKRKEQELEHKLTSLTEWESKLTHHEDILTKRSQELATREVAVKELEDISTHKTNNQTLSQELAVKQAELKKLEFKLKKHENRLFEIEQIQQARIIEEKERQKTAQATIVGQDGTERKARIIYG
jgi:flagellar capping protein FliD